MSFPTVIYSSQRHVRSGESTAGFVLWLHVMLLHLPGNPLLLSLLWVCVLSALHLLVLPACKSMNYQAEDQVIVKLSRYQCSPMA